MSTERINNNQGTVRIDDDKGTVRLEDNQGTARISDSGGTAIISDAGSAAGIMSQSQPEIQGIASDEKRTGEVFTPGQTIEINGKNCTIDHTISMSSGEAVIYKITMDGKPFVLKHYKLETPLENAAKNVLKNIRDNPKDKIVKVFDFGRRYEQDFEIMEYAEGGTLDQYLREKGPIHDEAALKRIVQQITAGLEQLHGELNIIYQDLKPENIYFRDANKTSIILADFGISSLMMSGENRAEVRANATKEYAAPDLARIGNQTQVIVDPSVDYFALGITMMHLWLGEKPFHGMPEAERTRQIRDKDVIFPDDMPADYKTLIQGLIDPLPKPRWGNEHIQKWLAGESLQIDYRKTSMTYESQMFNEAEGYAKPNELAELMAKYPDKGITILYSDIVTSWLEKAGDNLRAQEIKNITSTYAQDRQTGLYFAVYTLDPLKPFVSNGGKTCSNLKEIADALIAESEYYIEELKNANARLYLYLEAREGSTGKLFADQFLQYFNEYSPKRALNLVYLKLQEDGGQSIAIGSKTYQNPEELASETDSAQIALVKESVQEEDSLFLVWLSDHYGEFFTSTGGYNKLFPSDKFFLMGKLPFLVYKELNTNWQQDALSDLCALIHNSPGRFDLFEVYAAQGLPFTGVDSGLNWQPTAMTYLAKFFDEIADTETGLELVRFLHDHGANINEYSGNGTIPLYNAVYNRNVPLVKLLLELGADLKIIIEDSSILQWTLYNLTDREDDQDREDDRIAIANLLLDYKADVKTVDEKGRTALELAVFLKSSEKVNLASRLLAAGADINGKNQNDATPLATAISVIDNVKDKKAALAVIELLLKGGAKTETLNNAGYWSPLMGAADMNNIEAAQLLIKHGAKKDFTDIDANTAFVYAAQKKHTEMMALLNPGKDLALRRNLLLSAKILVSILAIGSVFLTMDVLARALLTFHLSFPVLAGASFLLSHLLTAYVFIVLLGPREYLISLRGTFNYIGSGLRYLIEVPLLFPLIVLLLQFLTRFLPATITAALSLPAELLTRPSTGMAMLASYIVLLAAMMTGTVFVNKINDTFAKKWRIYKQYI